MRCVILLLLLGICSITFSQSVARKWNEATLTAIRIDRVRPTVQARNLYHVSMAMYDAWAVYDDSASTYLFRKPELEKPVDVAAARNEAISYAAFRLLMHRYVNAFQPDTMKPKFESIFVSLMHELGYDESITDTDYATGSPAMMGNHIASLIIKFSRQDGSNEDYDYANKFYEPINSPLFPLEPGNPGMVDCNRWQPLALKLNCDQNGICFPGRSSAFLSAEWGEVVPFALKQEDLGKFTKGNYEYWVYHDPGPPPLLDSAQGLALSQEFMWNFSLVSIWSSHLDQRDGVMMDISPAAKGNIPPGSYPTTLAGLKDFYDLTGGGDIGRGYTSNPKTGLPYQKQIVPRGDYARVLAEFWADGPNSETPPGHWFTILNYVSDHPLLEKKFQGKGPVLDALEWDVKSYFMLGGAMHDAAVSAWGIKGYYDYVRPISAIRFMADKGQSTSSALPHYHPAGIPLQEGFIELVKQNDPLAGSDHENVGKIKLKSWRGTSNIRNPATDQAGVGWILAENWVPYQRSSFVTPPFAGYVSGHSTFSSAGAEILTLLTGDEYFPGGLGEFAAKKNKYLVFEEGPSRDITLQWARYKDAADQCSLSRIWGGIHPPVDDMPGRLIGNKIGTDAFFKAMNIFSNVINAVSEPEKAAVAVSVYPNPVARGETLTIESLDQDTFFQYELVDLLGRIHGMGQRSPYDSSKIEVDLSTLSPGIYFVSVKTSGGNYAQKIMVR
ncbi:MAG: T9SS type A sorting domain-containing protein [Cyclobacteriaceae bacterium]|nr:T9SS type A sorting domain-containing protein [Cyclobacteriaceae bacterium]